MAIGLFSLLARMQDTMSQRAVPVSLPNGVKDHLAGFDPSI